MAAALLRHAGRPLERARIVLRRRESRRRSWRGAHILAALQHWFGVEDATHEYVRATAESWLRADGVRFLQVKTLGPSRPDEGYRRARAFYAALGFAPLEETTALWGPSQPALIMIKCLDAPGAPA